MFTCERKIGRLVELRVTALKSVADVDAYTRATRERVQALQPARAIILADHRPVAIYSQPVADRLVELFTSLNVTVERAALAAARTNATLTLQIERIVRESSNPNRRVFHEPTALMTWLGEVLSPAEIARGRDFLAEFQPPRT